MSKTIAFSGCTDHIGTTTQAIQAILTVMENGQSACYLEMNKSLYIENLLKLYRKAEDHKEFIKFNNIELYRKEYTNKVKNKNYNFIIRDYGNANLTTFEETSFSEQPIKIVVCGSKPNEVFNVQKLLSKPIYDDAFFIFNFVPENEKLAILPLMGNKQERTFFSDIIIDPFKLNPNSIGILNKIVSLKSSTQIQQTLDYC